VFIFGSFLQKAEKTGLYKTLIINAFERSRVFTRVNVNTYPYPNTAR